MNSGYRYMSASRSKFGSLGKSKEHKFAVKNGGEIGGISNDGNTCFMNSVLQSLASSKELLKFIDSYLYSEIEISESEGRSITTKTNTPKPELVFTTALKTLLDNINGAYGTRGKEFSTKPLLNRMPNGPKQNFFSGYNQEDAQEFYQLVMNLLEREYRIVSKSRKSSPEPQESEKKEAGGKFVDRSTVNDLISGCEKLGKLGKVYVPASQVDSNLVDSDNKVLPLDLITPVDGVSVERIGCLSCGEVGGIRYSVNSGLNLNLPYSSSYYTNFNLNGLLDEWSTPEIIEDVNCNRCGLMQTKEFLLKQINSLTVEKVTEQFKERLQKIDIELEKPHITDEVFEKLTIKQMIRKTRKSKQILLSRPPPLLSIHINRSVFDPTTYRIAKNSSNVTFPVRLDLTPYVAEPKDVNMDARLPFRKQDERLVKQSDNEDKMNAAVSISSSESLSDNDDSEELISNAQKAESTKNTDMVNSSTSLPSNPSLLYNLKAVISHYGTHNYGHYICYRKLRGTWWRISDESVYDVSESEVLNGQGTFMLFYEFDDGVKEILQELDDKDDSDKGSDDSSDEEKMKISFEDEPEPRPQEVATVQLPKNNSIGTKDEAQETNRLSQSSDEIDIVKENDEVLENYSGQINDVEYSIGEERAHL